MYMDPIIYLIFILTVSCDIKSCQSRFKDFVTKSLRIDSVKLPPDLMTSFRKIARLKGYEHTMPEDEFRHVSSIDMIYRCSDVIAQHTGVTRSNSSASLLHYWLASALMRSSSPKEAVKNWRIVESEHKIDRSWRTVQSLFEHSTHQIGLIYKDVQHVMSSPTSELASSLAHRIYGGQEGSHAWCDATQARQEIIPNRTLDSVRESGLKIDIDIQKMHLLKESYQESLPLIELAKNKRFLTINGLRNAKVALIVHDHFDHHYTFNLLDRNGILRRYKKFLDKIGNTHATDIFSREGELIASVAYDYRYAQYPYFKHPAYFRYGNIKEVLENAQGENPERALGILEGNKLDTSFINKLEVVASGVYTELMQQRLKNGVIKCKGKDATFSHILTTLDPDYLALVVETYYELSRNSISNGTRLAHLQIMIEDFLHKAVTDKNSLLMLHVNEDSVMNFKPDQCSVPIHKRVWIEKNIGAIADRASIL
jgi:hypothetical protein